MIRRELEKLLDILETDEYHTAIQLADILAVSEKTARLRIKSLNEELEIYGASVISKPRFGYKLCTTDQEKFDQFKKTCEKENDNYIPDSGEERSEYLLAYLVWHPGYVKADELCEFLYISRPTLTKSLRTVEMILRRYDLEIERKPNYGMRLQGKELDIRRLVCDYFVRRNCLVDLSPVRTEKEVANLAGDIRKMLGSYEIPLSETAFENFVEYVYVACKRMKHGKSLTIALDDIPETGIREKSFVKELAEYLGRKYKCIVTNEEKSYIQLYLSGRRIVGNVVENDSNFVIREHLDRIALEMFEYIVKEYHMDFRNDFDIRMSLNQHLVPLDIRLRFDIPLHNPLLDDIKKNYSLAYQISCEVSQILENHYQKRISEDEIGYLALIFELAIERKQNDEKSDILVVCSTGKGSSRLLKYKYEQEFSDYLNHIYVCDLIGLESFDFSKVHYVFTTVPITKEIPVPIVEVGMFLGQDDVQKVTNVLKKGPSGYLEQYYGRKRFFANVPGKTKGEVLEYLCEKIQEQEQVDDDFYELVLERESYIQMDYGNMIAIPHPNRIASEESFAYVAVLEHPVIWNSHPAQVILLTSIGRQEDRNRQGFYEATARFALNKNAIETLLKYPDYDQFLRLIKEN